MSYILDAIKKSEKARGGRISPEADEEPPRPRAAPSRPSGASHRLLYLIAFVLSLNLLVFVFRTAPRRDAGSKSPPSGRPAARQNSKPTPARFKENPANVVKTAAVRQPAVKKTPEVSPAPRRGATASAAPERLAQNRQAPKVLSSPSTAPAPSPARELPRKEEARKPRAPAPAPPPRPKEVTAKKAAPSEPSGRDESSQTAVALKAADLKALLEKQAEHLEKAPGPAPGKFTGNAGFAGPDAPEEPDPGAPRISRLPARIRESLPRLSVSMLVYSGQPADRFIYINGSKRHEGDAIASGLKLVRITRDGAIFTYLGRSFYKGVLGD